MVASSIVNIFLFNPPEVKPYAIGPKRIIKLKTRHGNTIAATYIARANSNITLLYSHGNAEDLNTCYWYMSKLSQSLDVNVIGYDYSGYGNSTGKPSEENVYADIDAVYQHLTLERQIPQDRIILYGRSLGSGPSCYLASKTARMALRDGCGGGGVAGLILHSAFISVYRVVMNINFTCMGDKFVNIDRITNIQCPVIIIHGMYDTIVPCDHGRLLYETFLEYLCPSALNYKYDSNIKHRMSKVEAMFIKGMGHNDCCPKTEAMIMKYLNQFLDYHILARQLWMRKPRKSIRPKVNETDIMYSPPIMTKSASIRSTNSASITDGSLRYSSATSNSSVSFCNRLNYS